MNSERTIWPIDKTIDHLKQRGVRRVFVALGSPEAATIARIRKAEGAVSEKIPEDLAEYRQLGTVGRSSPLGPVLRATRSVAPGRMLAALKTRLHSGQAVITSTEAVARRALPLGSDRLRDLFLLRNRGMNVAEPAARPYFALEEKYEATLL